MIEIPIVPVPKPRMTQSDRWKKRPAVIRYYEYADKLRELWGDRPVPETFWIFFYLPIPPSWSAKKRALYGAEIPHQQRPDVDNLLKAFLDALCEDDSFVYDVRSTKLWSDKPRIQVMSL